MSDQYAFLVVWIDPLSSYRREFKLFYFIADGTIELWDTKLNRLFLKRIKCDKITLKDIFVGASLKIFCRLMKVIDYGDIFTQSAMSNYAQKTFGIVKPDLNNKLGVILKTIIDNDLKIVNLKMVQIEETHAMFLYERIEDKNLLPAYVEHITSGPILVFELLGENAIQRWMTLVGPEDPADAKIHAPDSLRARFGTDLVKNAVYASNSIQTVEKDVELFWSSKKNRFDMPLCVTLQNSSCCVIKPCAIKEGKLGDIVSMIEDVGFHITGMVMRHLNMEQVENFYEIYKHILPEYQAMVEELSSGACVAIEVVGSETKDTAVEFRKVVGPHDPEIARALRSNTIRAKYGKTKIENAVHVTDLPDDAPLEAGVCAIALVVHEAVQRPCINK